MKKQLSPWLVRSPQAPGSPAMTLYCFAFAGGSASAFMPWQADLGPNIDVCAIQLPGRGMRMLEPAWTSLPAVVDAVVDAIVQDNPGKFAFFGHSLGTVIAFEVTRSLAQRGIALPFHLFMSGAAAPPCHNKHREMHKLPDAEFIEKLGNYNGTPPEILEHKELMALLLPMIRADFQLVETYEYQAQARLTMPITSIQGRDDPYVTVEASDAWAQETTEAFAAHWFDGDHFYLIPQRAAVLDVLRGDLGLLQLAA